MTPQRDSHPIQLRHPTIADGPGIWRLVREAGALDVNSSYLYLLLCRDFADCCAVAESGGELHGFTTGYRSATRPDVWFLWQVGVAADTRSQGLAGRMAHFVLNALAPEGVQYLETMVAPSNDASRALFRGIARRLDTELRESELFAADLFPEGAHEAEPLLRVGPFSIERASHAFEAGR